MGSTTASRQTRGNLVSSSDSTGLSARGGLLQRTCHCGGEAGTEALSDDAQLKESVLQRLASGADEPDLAPSIVHDVLHSPGRPLDPKTRAYMEPRFGHDFSRVRVHFDAIAAESAQAVSAHAYTVGSDIVFGDGRYAPETEHGRKLLAHELTHVIQQGGFNGKSGSLPVGPSTDAYEQQADSVANEITSHTMRLTGVDSLAPGKSDQRTNTADAEKTSQFGPVSRGGLSSNVVNQPAAKILAASRPSIQRDANSDDYQKGYQDGLNGIESGPVNSGDDAQTDYNEGHAKGEYELNQQSPPGGAQRSSPANESATSTPEPVATSSPSDSAISVPGDSTAAPPVAASDLDPALTASIADSGNTTSNTDSTTGAAAPTSSTDADTVAASGIPGADNSNASSGGTPNEDPESIRGNLVGQVNAVSQQIQNENPNELTADPSQIESFNSHIDSLNAVLPGASALPELEPVAVPIGTVILRILAAIGAALLSEAAFWILLAAIVIIAIIALVYLIIKYSKDNAQDQNKDKEKDDAKDQNKDKEKDKDEEDEKDSDEQETEDDEEDEDDEDDESPLRWDPNTRVQEAVTSGGIVGALVLGAGVPTPPHGLNYHGHHVWPVYAGGLNSQPQMGVFGYVHISIVHPLLNALLTSTFGISTHTTDTRNIAFIARLRNEPALRAQVVAVLTGFFATLNLRTTPPIPPAAYLPGIAASATALSL